jgi:hypothetical protein
MCPARTSNDEGGLVTLAVAHANFPEDNNSLLWIFFD